MNFMAGQQKLPQLKYKMNERQTDRKNERNERMKEREYNEN